MKNFIQDGCVLDLPAPYARNAGEMALIGSILGVAACTLSNGQVGAFHTKGVFEINKLSTDVVTVGAKLYWDDTNKRLTLTSTSNTLAGVATAAAGNGVATVYCRLNGSF